MHGGFPKYGVAVVLSATSNSWFWNFLLTLSSSKHGVDVTDKKVIIAIQKALTVNRKPNIVLWHNGIYVDTLTCI